MSDVGDLLELLHGAGDRWQTVHATVRNWHDTKLQQRATARWLEAERANLSTTHHRYVQGDPAEEEPAESEHRTRIWIAKPARWRQESEWGTSVGRDGTWWHWSEHNGLMSNEGDPNVGTSNPLGDHAHLLDPIVLVPTLRFARVERDGDVVRADGLPRDPSPHHLHYFGLPRGADVHRLTVDAERGIVLRVESVVDGELFAVTELESHAFDEEIAEATFVLEVPEGEVARSPGEFHARLSVEEIRERASFTVYAPTELPDGNWRLQAHHHAPLRGARETVHLMYHRADGRGWLTITEHAAGEDLPWARMQDAAYAGVVLGETEIALSSDSLDEDVLRAVAGTLEPV